MVTKRKRNKRYRPRPVCTPMIVGAALVFSPLEAIIQQLETDGTLTTSARGTPMFQGSDGTWYCTATAIQGVIDHCEMWCIRHGRELPLDSLREFQRFITYCMPITESLLQRLRRDTPALQAAMAQGNPDDMLNLLMQTQIKDELEKRNGARK